MLLTSSALQWCPQRSTFCWPTSAFQLGELESSCSLAKRCLKVGWTSHGQSILYTVILYPNQIQAPLMLHLIIRCFLSRDGCRFPAPLAFWILVMEGQVMPQWWSLSALSPANPAPQWTITFNHRKLLDHSTNHLDSFSHHFPIICPSFSHPSPSIASGRVRWGHRPGYGLHPASRGEGAATSGRGAAPPWLPAGVEGLTPGYRVV